jgi:opacity protein-like surface antigen
MNAKLALGLAALGLAASGNTLAQSPDWQTPMSRNFWGYIGASGGETKFRTECSSLFDCDRKDTGFKVYGGGKFNDLLGLELGYTDFGKIRASGGDTDAWAGSLSLTAGIPIGDRFSVFAKGGALYGRTDVRASASSLVDTGHKTGWGTTWGAGAALGITKTVQVRVDWDRYKLDFAGGSRDVDMLSAGLQMRF